MLYWGGKVYVQLHYQTGSAFLQTFGDHNLDQVILRELDNLVARRPWSSAFGWRPTPLDKFPPMVCHHRFIRSFGRDTFQDGVKDLFIARKMVIRNVACQNLPVVPVSHRLSHNDKSGAPHTCNMMLPNEYTSVGMVGVVESSSGSSNSGAIHRAVPFA